MARRLTPEGRRVTVCAKLSESEAAALDAARGTLRRGEWVRAAILAALAPPEPKPARQRQPAKRAAQAEPATPRRYRCPHPGKRSVGGWCAECDVMVAPGGDLPPGYVPPWAA